MTTDELIKLLEAFVGHLTVKDLRQGGDVQSVSLLEDDTYATLVKFIAGERPFTVDVRRPLPFNESTAIPGAGTDLFREDDEVHPIHIDATAGQHGPMTIEENGKVRRMTAAERWQAANPNSFRPQRHDPDEPLKLKGEFDGVQLP